MPIGAKVYHKDLRLNLIVCQIDKNGRAICINTQLIYNNIYQTITVDPSKLVLGWQSIYD